MIELEHLNLNKEGHTILSDITLTIKQGECVILTGESGSGKTSLINSLNGLIPELYSGDLTGKLYVNGDKLPPIDFNNYVREIGMVFQNPKSQFFTTTVLSELAFSMENYGVSRQEILERIDQIVAEFDLFDILNTKVSDLSGGQKQKVAFASACMLPHQLFLFDEPSSNLDEVGMVQLKKFMKQLKNKGCTMIIAEHKLHYLSDVADWYIVLHEGKIREKFSKERALNISDNKRKSLGLRSLSTEKVEIKEDKRTIQTGITTTELSFKYKKKNVLHFESMFFSSESIVGLIGKNGVGKTTLVKMLTGLLKPSSGSILYNGELIQEKERLTKSYLVMQDVNLQLFFETVEKEIITKATRLDLFSEVVSQLNLIHLLDRHPQTLSGGEKQRVVIASAILSGKKWLFLDEPTSGLDYKNMLEVSNMLKWIQTNNLTIIVISHDQEFLNLTCDMIYKL